MFRPWLQKRINHFYRNYGRENNNHRERIYHETNELMVKHRYPTFIFPLFYFQSPKNLFPLNKKKINETINLQITIVRIFILIQLNQTNIRI